MKNINPLFLEENNKKKILAMVKKGTQPSRLQGIAAAYKTRQEVGKGMAKLGGKKTLDKITHQIRLADKGYKQAKTHDVADAYFRMRGGLEDKKSTMDRLLTKGKANTDYIKNMLGQHKKSSALDDIINARAAAAIK